MHKSFNLQSIDDLLSPEEAAAWMRMPETTFSTKVRKGEIPKRRYGHKTFRFWPREILEKGGGKLPVSCNGRKPSPNPTS